MKFISFLVLSFAVFISGCTDEFTEINTKGSPEDVAVDFFDAIYNENNLEKAAKVCGPQLARTILHYKSTKAVARHLFNMSYTSVKIKTEDSGIKIRAQFKESAIITIYFDGLYYEKRLRDVKRISLIQIDGNWAIDKILKDPF